MSREPGKLIMLRHGESEWNRLKKIGAPVEVALTAKGREQAGNAGEMLKVKEINRLYVSQYGRAQETANIILEKNNYPLDKDSKHESACLNERDEGWLIGLTVDQIENGMDKNYVNHIRFGHTQGGAELLPMSSNHPHHPNNPDPAQPKALYTRGGETLGRAMERVGNFFKQELLPKLNAGENILVVAHSDILLALNMVINKIDANVPLKELKDYKLDNAVPVEYSFSEINPDDKEIGGFTWQADPMKVYTLPKSQDIVNGWQARALSPRHIPGMYAQNLNLPDSSKDIPASGLDDRFPTRARAGREPRNSPAGVCCVVS